MTVRPNCVSTVPSSMAMSIQVCPTAAEVAARTTTKSADSKDRKNAPDRSRRRVRPNEKTPPAATRDRILELPIPLETTGCARQQDACNTWLQNRGNQPPREQRRQPPARHLPTLNRTSSSCPRGEGAARPSGRPPVKVGPASRMSRASMRGNRFTSTGRGLWTTRANHARAVSIPVRIDIGASCQHTSPEESLKLRKRRIGRSRRPHECRYVHCTCQARVKHDDQQLHRPACAHSGISLVRGLRSPTRC